MAAFDSVIGAIASSSQNRYSMKIFVSGFFTNALIAIAFTMFGESLDVDIFLAAIFVFVYRIFNNLAAIRRFMLDEVMKFFSKRKFSISELTKFLTKKKLIKESSKEDK